MHLFNFAIRSFWPAVELNRLGVWKPSELQREMDNNDGSLEGKELEMKHKIGTRTIYTTKKKIKRNYHVHSRNVHMAVVNCLKKANEDGPERRQRRRAAMVIGGFVASPTQCALITTQRESMLRKLVAKSLTKSQNFPS